MWASTRIGCSPLGGVPMQDGNEAAKELERGMTQLGFKGVEILTNVNGKELSDPAFVPFWKKAEELDALVLIHPNWLHAAATLRALLLQQCDREPARYHGGPPLPDLRRRIRTASKAPRPGRARRRLPGRLLRPHRSCLGGAIGRTR
jgi:predicted TIM-barrel fold metal-dependent hydrolase